MQLFLGPLLPGRNYLIVTPQDTINVPPQGCTLGINPVTAHTHERKQVRESTMTARAQIYQHRHAMACIAFGNRRG